MATQAEVLQKVSDYCTEKQYTLNDDFRSQFSERFAKANAEANVEDEAISNSIKFSIDTAFSAASKELKLKDEAWNKEKSDYLKQIEELKKKSEGKKNGDGKKDPITTIELPKDVKEELEELKTFKTQKEQQEKHARVLSMAKKNVREDLHGQLEALFNAINVDYSKDDEALVKQLNESFTSIYQGQVGNIKPKVASESIKDDEALIGSVPKINVY